LADQSSSAGQITLADVDGLGITMN
jgi:hypothetical protein